MNLRQDPSEDLSEITQQSNNKVGWQSKGCFLFLLLSILLTRLIVPLLRDIPNLWGVPGYQSVATVAAGRNPSWAAATNTSSSSSSPVSSPGSSSGSGSSSTPVSSSASATVSTSAPAIIPSVTRTESFNETVIIPTPTSLGANVTAQTPASQSTAVSTSRTGGAGTLAMGGLSLVLGGLLMTGLATLV